LGLRLTPEEIAALDLWIAAQQISSKALMTGAGGRP